MIRIYVRVTFFFVDFLPDEVSFVSAEPNNLGEYVLFDMDCNLHYYLWDIGPGFAPEVRDMLFEAFVTTKASGIGLGPTICRQIIEKHGGTIEANKHSSQGAVIRIRLPRG
ncbi:MAG TPA: HAMP domain-containing histidine kinase [Phycisphaerales bacterium]|nr:HAMP domain-containing histidine kinase [Phycisphaerales bacterium]